MSETRDRILETARRLFERSGYSAASVREIAEASGIAKATIYHHFADKEAMLLALLERCEGEQAAMVGRIAAEADPRKRLEAAARESLGFLSANISLMQAARRETAQGRERVRKRILPGIGRLRSLASGAIAEGSAAGRFRAVDPDRAASVLVAMIQGSCAGALLDERKRLDLGGMADSILEVFFDGIARR